MAKTKKIQQMKLIFLFVAIITLVLPMLSAFGPALPYSRTMPLTIAPGETKNFQVNLQVSMGEGNKTIRVSIVNGSDVASLVDSNHEYKVPEGRAVNVPVRVTVPKEAVEGQEHVVTFLIQDITPVKGSGMVQFSQEMEASIIVLVKNPPPVAPLETPVTTPTPIENPQQGSGSILWAAIIIVIVIIIGIIIFFVFKFRKK
jgi:hypothetical protein